MKQQTVKSNILLLLAATIWGFAFVAQRVSMKYIGAFTFNGIRFMLGCISLIPIIIFFSNAKDKDIKKHNLKNIIFSGTLAGIFLFWQLHFNRLDLLVPPLGKLLL